MCNASMDDDASGDPRTEPAPEATTSAAESIPTPPAWELFLIFIFGSVLFVLAARWIIARCCRQDEGTPVPPAGKTLAGMRIGSPVFAGHDMELNLLEPNDEDSETIVIDRAAKTK